jgi:hypothetical protein
VAPENAETSPASKSEFLPIARGTIEWLARTFQEYRVELGPREFVSVASLFAALRHFSGICTLVEAHAYASAFALLRVEWQSLLNGAWLFAACPDAMLEDYFLGNRDFPKIPRLIKEIESSLDHEMTDAKAFTQFQVLIGKFMHNHTHAGHRQILHMIEEHMIAESVAHRELDVLLFISIRMAFMAASLIAKISDDSRLSADTRERLISLSTEFDRIFPEPADAVDF